MAIKRKPRKPYTALRVIFADEQQDIHSPHGKSPSPTEFSPDNGAS